MAGEINAPGQGGIQVKASEDQLKGRYSSHMQVLHTREEFVLDFMALYPPQGQLVSRVLVSPAHFKRMVAALTDNLAKYEKQFGKVQAGTAETSKEKDRKSTRLNSSH